MVGTVFQNTELARYRGTWNTQWNLGSFGSFAGPTWLLGWRQNPVPLDGGMPKAVSAVFSQAFTASATVMGLCTQAALPLQSDSRTDSSSDILPYQAVALTSATRAQRLLNRFTGEPDAIYLVASRDSMTIARLFDNPTFNWSLQGQVILLSSRNELDLSRIQWKMVKTIFSGNWLNALNHLLSIGIEAVIKPGVDGDVAGVVFLKAELAPILWKAIIAEAKHANMICRDIDDEPVFCDWLSGQYKV